MEHYRPTYDYARKAANVDILIFINDSFKKFHSLPSATDSVATGRQGAGVN
jgi:hypothetical protein